MNLVYEQMSQSISFLTFLDSYALSASKMCYVLFFLFIMTIYYDCPLGVHCFFLFHKNWKKIMYKYVVKQNIKKFYRIK